MQAVPLACPHCRMLLQVPPALPAGQALKCPRCGGAIAVPWAAGHGGRGIRLALVLGGTLLVLGAAVGGAVWYFVNLDKPPGPDQTEAAAKDRAGKKRPGSDNGPRPAPPKKPDPFRLPPLAKAKQTQVNQAIDRGVQFLKSTQLANGGWAVVRSRSAHSVGSAALPGLTLLECGVPATDPVIEKAAAYIRSVTASTTGTYDLALAILFLDRLGQKDKDRVIIRTLALRLVAGQTGKGGWGYQCPVLGTTEHKELDGLLQELRTQIGVSQPKLSVGKVVDLPAHLQKLVVLRNELDVSVPTSPDKALPSYDDNSCTQFAVLALLAARSYDVPLDRTLALVVKRFRTTQQANGSWSYRFTGNFHVSRFPTMTCAGLLGLAVGHSLVKDARKRGQKLQDLTGADQPTDDANLQKALEWLGKHIDVAMDAQPDLYYLWSVERVGVVFHLPRIGGKEWYPWGVDLLLGKQQANGSWQGRRYFASAPPVDTSLALLFLKRADLARDLTSKLHVEE